MIYMYMVETLVAHLASGIVNGHEMGNGIMQPIYIYGTFDSLNVNGTFDKLVALLVMQWLNYMGFELCYGVCHAMGF